MDNQYQITKLADGIYAIDEGGVRSFLIEGDTRAALIDCGFGKGDLLNEARALTRLPIELYLTHADPDHFGGAQAFSKLTLHPDDLPRFKAKSPGYSGEIAHYVEGDTLDIAPYKFRVIHIPGHTPGSVALYEAEKRFLISGDSAQLGAVFLFGEGRDKCAYIRSLEKLCALKPDIDAIYPSHGPIPIAPDALDELLAGALKLIAGELEPSDPPMPLPCKLYKHMRARFLA